MKFPFVVLLAMLVAVTGCGQSSPSPTVPSSPLATGTWSGSLSDSTGQATVGWQVTQSGNILDGTISFTDPGRGMAGSGSVLGAMNARTISFHATVPSGGFQGAMSPCSMVMDARGTMSEDGRTITGTYSGTLSGTLSGATTDQSCGGPMNNGQFTLTR